MKPLPNLPAAVVLAVLSWHPAAAQLDTSTDFRGMVTDPSNKPLGHVRVYLKESDGTTVASTATDGRGRFSISSTSGERLSLEFVPKPKSGLATALYENLPPRQDRQLIVHLPRGFKVTGRVVAAGNGLKGLTVKVTAVKPDNERERVYGGGLTTTVSDGRFTVWLMPGRKWLYVLNERYYDRVSKIKQAFTVTGDMDLADIQLPPAEARGAGD